MSKPESVGAGASSDRDLEAGLGKAPADDKAAEGVCKDVAVVCAAAPGEVKARKVVSEDPRLRWAFVRKVYAILAAQFAFTAAVAAVACLVRPIPAFLLSSTPAAWGVYISLLVCPFIVMWPMLKYREKHPVNLVLLGLFTLCISLSVGISSATFGGKIVLQAAVLTAAAVIGLTLFTFWAANRGHDFTFLFPFLFVCLLVLLVYMIIQIFFPLGKIGTTVYGCLATIVFSGFIIYDTNLLIKRHTYDEYVFAAISLYLDVINLFMAQLSLSSIQ